MKKIIASLALSTVLGTGFAAGAQAQTVNGDGGIYQLTITPNGGVLGGDALNPTDYLYTYEVTLTSESAAAVAAGTDITQFSINNILGYDPGTTGSSAGVVDEIRTDTGYTTDFGSNGATVNTSTIGKTAIFFQAGSNGLQTAGTVPTGFGVVNDAVGPGQGDTILVGFDSKLPPTSTVSLSSNGQNAGLAGPADLNGGGSSVGPGPAAKPAIPETSSFALLGLGLLPLGFLARRRIARNS